MKNKQQGFSIPLLILMLVVLGIGIGIGVFISTHQTDADKTVKSSTSSDTSETYGFVMPDDWNQMKCGEAGSETNPPYALLSPSSDGAADCDDRTNTILISDKRTASYDACRTDAEIAKYKESKPLSYYSCEVQTVAGVRVVVSTEDTGGLLMLNYDFEKASITYYADSNGVLSESNTVKEIAESVVFK